MWCGLTGRKAPYRLIYEARSARHQVDFIQQLVEQQAYRRLYELPDLNLPKNHPIAKIVPTTLLPFHQVDVTEYVQELQYYHDIRHITPPKSGDFLEYLTKNVTIWGLDPGRPVVRTQGVINRILADYPARDYLEVTNLTLAERLIVFRSLWLNQTASLSQPYPVYQESSAAEALLHHRYVDVFQGKTMKMQLGPERWLLSDYQAHLDTHRFQETLILSRGGGQSVINL